MQEITYKSVIQVDSPDGGTLDLVSPFGDIVHTFHVPQGRHRASLWLSLCEPGYTLQIGERAVCFRPRGGVSVSVHPDALKSDANPDFVPTSASRLERQMRIELNELKAARLQIMKEARQRHADNLVVEAIPNAPAEAVEPTQQSKESDAK